MRLALTALSDTNTTRTNLTYINGLITDAASKGEYHININEKYIDSDMISDLETTYGYKITTRTFDMGTNVDYLIEWM
jgi:hypothetical protein